MKDLRLVTTAVSSLLLTAVSSAAFAGYYYEAVTTNEGVPAGTELSTVHAWVDGDRAKVEFQETSQAVMFPAGGYLVTQDAGSTLYFVNPADMTIMTVDIDAMVGMAGTMMEAMGSNLNMEFSDFSNETLSEGAGGEILGYDTTLTHNRIRYTMSISVMGYQHSSRVEMENKVWCSDDFNSDGLRVWLRPDRFRTGNEDFDELIQQHYAAMNCLPLRTEVVTTTTSNGSASVTTTKTDVLLIREENVAASIFNLPENYEQVSFLERLMRSRPPAGQSGEGGASSIGDLLRGSGR
ncbi:MAG: hypothetical protein ACR2QQ_16125 [Gammaproteobacteria bacterium]